MLGRSTSTFRIKLELCNAIICSSLKTLETDPLNVCETVAKNVSHTYGSQWLFVCMGNSCIDIRYAYLLILIVLEITFLCVLGLYVYDACDGMHDVAGAVLRPQVFTHISLPPDEVFQGYISE